MQNEGLNFSSSFDGLPLCGKHSWVFFFFQFVVCGASSYDGGYSPYNRCVL